MKLQSRNINKKPLIDNIINRGWKVKPLFVIAGGARATTHTLSMESIETTFKILKLRIKIHVKEINVIAIQYAISIILHKRRIKTNEPLPIDTNSL